MLALLDSGRGDWGEIRLRAATIRVARVVEGEERDIHHFLESLVQQANAEPEREAEREPTPQEARDRRLADGFRVFGSEAEPR